MLLQAAFEAVEGYQVGDLPGAEAGLAGGIGEDEFIGGAGEFAFVGEALCGGEADLVCRAGGAVLGYRLGGGLGAGGLQLAAEYEREGEQRWEAREGVRGRFAGGGCHEFHNTTWPLPATSALDGVVSYKMKDGGLG